MKAETRKVQSWRRVGTKCDESDGFREVLMLMGPDTLTALETGEHPGGHFYTQGKCLQFDCEMGKINVWGGVEMQLTACVFDVQFLEVVNMDRKHYRGQICVIGCCHLLPGLFCEIMTFT